MEDTATLLWAGAAIAAAVYVIKWKMNPLNSIPTVGSSPLPILSLFGSINFMLNGKKIIEQGYRKYHGSAFRVPLLDQWVVVVAGPKMVDEIRRRPDDELSFSEGVADSMQIKYTLNPDTEEDPYHVDIIKEKLTRSVPAILPDVIDELTLAVPEHIPAKTDEWLEVHVMSAMQQIIARASSRVFVGLPICRNKEWLNLSISFTIDIVKDRTLVKFFPEFMKPLVGKLSSNVQSTLRKAIPHLKPVIDERREMMEKFGDDWNDKPNDMLQWVMDVAQTRDNSYDAIARRIMLINFAAIHTSSNTVSHAIYHLAEHPECLQPLREEMEPLLKEEGWTKNAMGKMWKLDSFLRESQRYNGIGLTSLTRKSLKDITLHDGTRIPKGTMVMAAADATHHDDAVYADADVFDPFRFSRMREAEGESTKHQFVNTSVDYISFGHGKHACPGRFFAANELKSLLAFIILNYDLKLGGDGQRPRNIYWGLNVIPAPNGKVLFKRRAVPAS
ncbi:cytochrome P450 [Pilatotrama ljubarskyi]|nr:cytochrome P450 [Pilatotrama ljubarskyi]